MEKTPPPKIRKNWATACDLGIVRTSFLMRFDSQNVSSMEPKGNTNCPQNPCHFCVVFLITFGDILVPSSRKGVFGGSFRFKNWSFPKSGNLADPITATQIQGSGASKMGKIGSKTLLFADMVSGPVLGLLLVAFGAKFPPVSCFLGTRSQKVLELS